jgi:cytochrome c553
MLAADPSMKRPDLLARCGTCHDEGTKAEQKYRRAIQPTLSEGSSR